MMNFYAHGSIYMPGEMIGDGITDDELISWVSCIPQVHWIAEQELRSTTFELIANGRKGELYMRWAIVIFIHS